MPFGFSSVPTAQIDSRGPAYHEDTYSSTAILNGAKNVLGTSYYYVDSAGRQIKIKYVRLNNTVASTTLYCGPVYYKDNTLTVVTAKVSEAKRNYVAGVLLNTSLTNGDFTWILTAGYCGGSSDSGWGAVVLCDAAGSAVIGDLLVGGTSGQTPTLAAAGSPSYKVAYVALTAASGAGGTCDGWVVCEDYGTC
jgi:hypothetical protein